MKNFLNVLDEMAAFQEIKEGLKKEGSTVLVSGLVDSGKTHMAESLREDLPFHLYVTYDEKKAAQISGDSRFFGGETLLYPAKDIVFYSADMHSNDITARRAACIKAIIDRTDDPEGEFEPLTIVTTIDGLTDLLVPIEKYRDNMIRLTNAVGLSRDEIVKKLARAGYKKEPMVTAPGQISERGGILDIFPITEENPIRVEFWGDDVDSIRTFDMETQRSIENIQACDIFPAREDIFSESEIKAGIKKIEKEMDARLEELGDNDKKKTQEKYERCNRLRQAIADMEISGSYGKFFTYFEKNKKTLVDYFPLDKTLVTWDEPAAIEERAMNSEAEFKSSVDYRFENGYIIRGQMKMLESIRNIYKACSSRRFLFTSTLYSTFRGYKPDLSVHAESRGVNAYNNSFTELVKDLKRYKKLKYRVIFVTSSRSRRDRLVDEFRENDIEAYSSDREEADIAPGLVMVTEGGISRGFSYPEINYVVITENDIYTSGRKKKNKSKKNKVTLDELKLSIGDYVVHENYGIGIYQGIVKQTVEGIEKDYIKIDYAGNSCVYILATQTDMLQKYASADTDQRPKVNKIGTAVWSRTKSKTRDSVELVAADLIKLYARRANMHGFRFEPDSEWQREFEEMFPYEETQDQLDAIAEIKADMESDRIMDRLLCGDVGFGKTEVALRSAFKAVQSGKQVAVLAPTTILAGQHYDTFVQRMKAFPVTIELMSGMKTRGQNIETARNVNLGLTDIVIGTHRILSDDVKFKDLGLLIIDEEQRFGVNHKEKLKKLKGNVDVLALSATPIPRTISMSLAGIRDMSTLEEPPVDRNPIQTFVTQQDDGIIREAIKRELSRQGQVYYVYNRVNRIEEVQSHLEELVPEAVFACIHGQMDNKTLTRTMTGFINGEIDVLISTTIIETGLDIPNVNTIIIENAENFGLSQLYQLRGRVGRSARTSYAFLLYRRDKVITEVAQKRLSAIGEMTDLGSGYRLAMKDLEIRGAGAMLGKTQHGHMAAVGFEMYTRMLNEAVTRQKGIEVPDYFETSIDIVADAYLPDTYVEKESQKLDLYKRIASISDKDQLRDMEDELTDVYGPIPGPAQNLLTIAIIKAIAHAYGICEIKGGKRDDAWLTRIVFRGVDNKGTMSDEAVRKFADSLGGAASASLEDERILVWRVTNAKFQNAGEYLKGLCIMVENMGQYC
ncbi:MAG: transcription-repair coupling factor [Clostridiales bacterium]|nr:transcription-repair coupling factor [Clostridiales bacterium]MBS5877624.1 transcription-repair coupling factor [Clostridiales bacterium]